MYANRYITIGLRHSNIDRKRGDSGEFVPTVTPERVLDVFDAVEGPVVTGSDVADELGCTTEAARRTLEQLHEEGRLARRRTAGRLIDWRVAWRTLPNSSVIGPDCRQAVGGPLPMWR